DLARSRSRSWSWSRSGSGSRSGSWSGWWSGSRSGRWSGAGWGWRAGAEGAAAAGVHPYTSRVMLWLRRTGRVEQPETEAMRWGTRIEPLVLAALEEEGYELLPAPVDGFRR